MSTAGIPTMIVSVANDSALDLELPNCTPRESNCEVNDDSHAHVQSCENDGLDKKEEEEQEEKYHPFMINLVSDMAVELANRSIWSNDDMRGRIKKALGGHLPKSTIPFPFRIWLVMLWLSGYALSFGLLASCLMVAYMYLVVSWVDHVEAVIMLNIAFATSLFLCLSGLLNTIVSWSWEAAIKYRATVFTFMCFTFVPVPIAYYFKGSAWVWYRLDMVMIFAVLFAFVLVTANAKKKFIAQGLMKPFHLIQEIQFTNSRRRPSAFLRQKQASILAPFFSSSSRLRLPISNISYSLNCRPMNLHG